MARYMQPQPFYIQDLIVVISASRVQHMNNILQENWKSLEGKKQNLKSTQFL